MTDLTKSLEILKNQQSEILKKKSNEPLTNNAQPDAAQLGDDLSNLESLVTNNDDNLIFYFFLLVLILFACFVVCVYILKLKSSKK